MSPGPKYRHLGRDSAHRQALLRNLVTSLFTHESITTTWPKAKEAQRLAEKVVTLAKKNTEASRRRAHQIFYDPVTMVPKVFAEMGKRYAERQGGYTRVLRIEPPKEDQAPSAILTLVDGPKDMKFALTAATVARDRMLGKEHSDITKLNMRKILKYRGNVGQEKFDAQVKEFIRLEEEGMTGERDAKGLVETKKRVYWEFWNRRIDMYPRSDETLTK